MNSIITKKRIAVFAVLFFGFYILNSFFDAQIKDFFYNTSENMQAFLWKNGGEVFSNMKDLAEAYRKLTEENQKLLSQLADLESTKQDNNFLREALGLELNKDFELIYGEVIGKDISKDSILINIGAKEGVVKGFPVVLSNKILLGKVSDVYNDFSRVTLISNKDNLIDVEIPDSSVFALSKGLGNLKVALEMVPKDKQINEGSLIITSAMGGNYPSGLVVGKVKNIQKLDNEAFQKSDIELAFDLGTISRIFVIRNAQIVIQ